MNRAAKDRTAWGENLGEAADHESGRDSPSNADRGRFLRQNLAEILPPFSRNVPWTTFSGRTVSAVSILRKSRVPQKAAVLPSEILRSRERSGSMNQRSGYRSIKVTNSKSSNPSIANW
jgi:hypothetical protein